MSVRKNQSKFVAYYSLKHFDWFLRTGIYKRWLLKRYDFILFRPFIKDLVSSNFRFCDLFKNSVEGRNFFYTGRLSYKNKFVRKVEVTGFSSRSRDVIRFSNPGGRNMVGKNCSSWLKNVYLKNFGWAKIQKAHPLTTSRRREEIGTPSSLVSSSNPLMPSPAVLGQIFSF